MLESNQTKTTYNLKVNCRPTVLPTIYPLATMDAIGAIVCICIYAGNCPKFIRHCFGQIWIRSDSMGFVSEGRTTDISISVEIKLPKYNESVDSDIGTKSSGFIHSLPSIYINLFPYACFRHSDMHKNSWQYDQ